MRLKFLSAGKRPLKELNDICNALCKHSRVASGTAKPQQKTSMTSNAVADGAEARQVDEKTLFKNGGQRIVQVGSLRESPQFLGDLGRVRCEAEEIGKDPESLLDTFS
jgi:hypothetical protein